MIIRRTLIFLLLLSSIVMAQMKTIELEPGDKIKLKYKDWFDKATNSKLFKTTLVWYNQARLIAKSFNKTYDNFMRALRIIERELAFIEYMAKKVERISNFKFDAEHFWDSMAKLERELDMIDEIYTQDLQYFDYLIGRQHNSISDLLRDFNMPDFGASVSQTRAIWGTLPDVYQKDAKLSKLPVSRMTGSNEYQSVKNYKSAGAATYTLANDIKAHNKSNAELDRINSSPVKYLQFENAFYVDRLFERCIYIDQYKAKVITDGQILLSSGSQTNLKVYDDSTAISGITALR